MVEGLLDTAVVVDLLRGHPPAKAWLLQQGSIGVTPIVWLEILEGAKNLQAQRRAVEVLQHFDREELVASDYDWAIKKSLGLKLSHNVGVWDCLIGSVANRLRVPLYTTNLKHFRHLLEDLARKPY
jgi:predicted nucleic acid-binding protein